MAAAPPTAALSGGDDRISQVPGEPPVSVCPALRLRPDPGSQTHTRSQHGPRAFHYEGAGRVTFEARSHGFQTRCLRFAGWVTPPQRKTRFRVRVRLSRTGLGTRRVPMKGFGNDVYISFPFPKLCLAREKFHSAMVPQDGRADVNSTCWWAIGIPARRPSLNCLTHVTRSMAYSLESAWRPSSPVNCHFVGGTTLSGPVTKS